MARAGPIQRRVADRTPFPSGAPRELPFAPIRSRLSFLGAGDQKLEEVGRGALLSGLLGGKGTLVVTFGKALIMTIETEALPTRS